MSRAIKSVDFSAEESNKRVLFTTHDRSVVTKACIHEGLWQGSRKGFRVTFSYKKLAEPGRQIGWAVIGKKRWEKHGSSGTVFDAMQDVESAVANKELDTKLERIEAGEKKA